jgi:hypothetical protein
MKPITMAIKTKNISFLSARCRGEGPTLRAILIQLTTITMLHTPKMEETLLIPMGKNARYALVSVAIAILNTTLKIINSIPFNFLPNDRRSRTLYPGRNNSRNPEKITLIKINEEDSGINITLLNPREIETIRISR